jgi:glyoxylase-like metal-dependent hydrolase (beta-lactamase superfamily II)
MSDNTYEVHAIKYARHHRMARENFIGGDPHDGTDMPLDYFIWLIRGSSNTFVFDTGFDENRARQRQRSFLCSPGVGLRALGVDPDSVGNVVLSHMHYDHAGNNDLFPAATYHVQDREMAFCTGRCMCHAYLRQPFEAEDVTAMVGRTFAGRTRFHDGAAELADGVTLHLIGGHSAGLQVMRIRTRRGYVVLASDATHFYANMENGRPFAIAADIREVLEGYDTLRRLASSPRHIIPGHDPLVMQRYPTSAPGLEGLAVRLDADPSD